ncbi:hypothetical protein [Pontibacter sp. G13]|uniref:hypothetical protein n=1 Tax=Pontibacter sp. G13 TaxID=3074898 RepID=UPI0028899F7C|nr:hypothetical protein [Pontibacter sp. G13]WNJ19412.1 hypothetical protein RJD25_02875 [Pontibacter sp. G13]
MMVTQVSNSTPLDNLLFSFTTPNEIVACGEDATFEVGIVNSMGFALTGQEVTIDLPPGVYYVPSSAAGITGPSVSESDISDLNEPVFTLGNLADEGEIEFSIDYRADVDGMNYMLGGNTPRNIVTLNTNEGTASENSQAYNILYAALNILSVNPTSQTITNGDTTTRSFNVVNAGNGYIDQLYISDIHNEDLEWISANVGTLNATKDTLILTSTDFQSIGNGDGYLNTNESISITQTLVGNSCEDQTISSVIQAHWGCDGQMVSTSNTNAHVTVNRKLPNISVSSTQDLDACFGTGELSDQSITLNNKGEGTALNVSVSIYKANTGSLDNSIFSAIDTSSIMISIDGGTPVHKVPASVTNTTSTGDYGCLGANPIGLVELTFPSISPGQKIVISFKTQNCCINACLGQVNSGWKYRVGYTDRCATVNSNNTYTGQSPKSANMSMFTESPSDISDGQTETFTYTISSYSNNFPEGDGGHYKLVFDIPDGLSWSGNSEDLTWDSGPNEWDSHGLNFNSSTKQLTAKFAKSNPFNLPKTEIHLNLTGDCSAPGASDGVKTVNLNVYYIPDSTCAGGTCEIPMMCGLSLEVYLHCPGPCDQGLSFRSYDIQRISFGEPDNNYDGKPDDSGSLNMSDVRTNRAMVSDTIRGTFYGLIKTSGSYPSWEYGYASTTIEEGKYLTGIGATLRVWDASTSQYLSCDDVPFTYTTDGNDRTWNYDFSFSTLKDSCGPFDGFQFGDGDSVWLYADYHITGNPGGYAAEVLATNEFYVSDIANPTQSANKFQCGTWRGKYTLIGYYLATGFRENFTMKACSKNVHQKFFLSIGDCCSNFNGGNMFPSEYRYWAHIKRAMVVLPPNYRVADMYVKQWRTKYTNSTATETANNIQPVFNRNDTLIFDLETYYLPYGGNIRLSDDGFSGQLTLTLEPTCDVPIDTYEKIDWRFTFIKAPRLRDL